jgi:uncharacterized protein (TIGR03083 family)
VIPLGPTDTTALFRPILDELLSVLRRLTPEDWKRPTVARRWRVRDVAAHLLDNDLRRLSAHRDGHVLAPERPIRSANDVARVVNALNAGGVSWSERLSPALIVELLAVTGPWVAEFLASLPPDAPAKWPVSWAGEHRSQQWMDTGREYTERWHHQAQIRDAVGASRLLEPRWMVPLLEISVRVLPHAYAEVSAPRGTSVAFQVCGETDANWTIEHDGHGWRLSQGTTGNPDALVRATADAAWRLLYNALPDPAADPGVTASGPAHLVAPLLAARSVVL